MKCKILYITAVSNQLSGGMTVINRNIYLLKSVPDAVVVEYRVQMQSKINALHSALTGGNLLLSFKDEVQILKMIKQEGFDFVFMEGTTSGHLADAIVKTGNKLIVFAHNVESVLYGERAKTYKYNVIELLKYFSVKRNEEKSVRLCTTLIGLSDRDSHTFKKLYGRSADVIVPISFPSVKLHKTKTNEIYGLFVGSNFFPNNEGITWFIQNVAPFINTKIKIVGSCCKVIASILPSVENNIEVLGIVDDLKSVYENASFIVVPIFKGSGMKTKTIEAMSYGKTIFGTDECFQGIECDYDKIGGLCNTAQEFIFKINNYSGDYINQYTLNLFEEKFSNNAVQEVFNKLFK